MTRGMCAQVTIQLNPATQRAIAAGHHQKSGTEAAVLLYGAVTGLMGVFCQNMRVPFSNRDSAVSTMRHLSVWAVEFLKLLIGRRLHPLRTQCPFCQQSVHLHINKAGRRHVFAHARGLYEGCRLCQHYVGKLKCLGSGTLMIFDPRPEGHQRFKLPDSLLEN